MQARLVFNRLRTSRVGSFVLSTLLVAPVALGGLWAIATWANAFNEDLQTLGFFCGVLPFIAGCVALDFVLHRMLYHQERISKKAIGMIAMLALFLAWPIIVLWTSVVAANRLPRLDERMPAPVTWWILLAGGWMLLTLICGAVYLLMFDLESGLHGS